MTARADAAAEDTMDEAPLAADDVASRSALTASVGRLGATTPAEAAGRGPWAEAAGSRPEAAALAAASAMRSTAAAASSSNGEAKSPAATTGDVLAWTYLRAHGQAGALLIRGRASIAGAT